ncbi:MAG: extracellular solute-binding protein [Spirochaetes bacterium]|nr:extracellular solute-binding protein [Spirochaetota bacterium]
MKKSRLFFLITALLLVASVLMLTGCKKKEADKGPQKIVFWHTMNPEETKTLETLVSKFKAENPEVEVQMEMVPFDGARQKFDTAAQAGNAPDVLRCEIAWTPNFADKGYLADLTDIVTDTNDYLNAPLNYNKYNDKLYGVPHVTDCLALFYNKRILKEAGLNPPTTMDELISVAKKLTKGDKYGFFMRGDSYWLQAFIWAFGGEIVSNDKVIQVNTPESISGIDFVINTLQKSGVMPVDTDFANDYVTAMNGFKEGKYAMIINGPWATADVLSGPEFQDPSNFGVAVIPKGPTGKYGSPVGGHNYVVSSDSKNIELAVKFINLINSTEAQVTLSVKNNLLPTRYSAYDDSQVASNELVQSFKAQLEVARNRPVIPEGSEIFNDFTEQFQKAWKHEISAQEAGDAIAQAWADNLGLIKK